MGVRLRTARKQRGLSLKELSERTGASIGLLSEIENNKARPSIGTLYSVANALQIAVAALFADEAAASSSPHEPYLPDVPQASGGAVNGKLAASDRATLELTGGIRWSRLTPGAETGIEFLEIDYQPGASSGAEMLHHLGREWLCVLEGEMLLELGFERTILKVGDCAVFDSETPHRLSNIGSVRARAIQVNYRSEDGSPAGTQPFGRG